MQVLICLACLCLVAPYAFSQPFDLRLIASSEQGLTLEFKPEWQPPRMHLIETQPYLELSFFGALHAPHRTGLPMQPFRSIPIALPSELAPTIEILEVESETLPNTLLAPFPQENARTHERIYKAAPNYFSKQPFALAEVSSPKVLRGVFVCFLSLYPLRFNPDTRSVTKFTRIVVQVNFAPARPLSPNFAPAPTSDEFFSGIINAEMVPKFSAYALPYNLFSTHSASTGVTQSVLRSGRFYKLEIREEGLYRLDRAYLESIGINLATVNPRRIKIYQNGSEELDTRINSPKPNDLQECAIFVSGEDDERFDANDFVLFYAKTTSGVKYDSLEGRLSHYLHRMSNSAFVFLSLDGELGKRIPTRPSLETPSAFQPTVFQWLSFVENDRINFSNTGLNFFDSPLNTGRNRATYQLSAAGIDRTRAVRLRAKLIAATTANEAFAIRESGSLLLERRTGITQNLDAYIFGSAILLDQTFSGTLIQGEQTNTQLEFFVSSETSNLYPDWIELIYFRQFATQNDFLKFNSLVGLTSTEAVRYQLSGFTAPPTVWDITDLSSITRISGEVTASSIGIVQSESPRMYREYVAFSERTAFRRPASAQLIANQNLRSLASSSNPEAFPEYIIVYGADFRSEAERLARYRSDRARLGEQALRTVAVEVGQIYNEFSGGKQDFTAIRDFVKLLYDRAPSGRKPKYLLLFGDGDWDYRDITGRRYSKVPVFESEESLLELSFAATTDDFFVAVDGVDFLPDLAVGRFTVQSVSEARLAVDKTIEYETSIEQGDWRNRVAFVADDGPNGNKPSDFNQFARDSENTIAAMRRVAPYINPVKIYASFFRAEAAAGGMRRPGAAREIITQLNRGVSVINYIGHGNPSVWAAERIFDPATSLPQLTNRERPTLCITATCDFGRNDDPNRQSGAEQMFVLPSGGASILIPTNRSIFITSGSAYPPLLFQRIFERDANQNPVPLGVALLRFKLDLFNAGDAEKFYLLGDPALRLCVGRTLAQLDSLNGIALPPSVPIQLNALSRVTLSGSVRLPSGAVNTAFNGTAAISVFDAPRQAAADHEGRGTIDEFYDVQNALIYRGLAPVRNGRFRINFVVPKDISYDSIKTGKVSLYLWQEDTAPRHLFATASGSFEQFVATGTNPDAPVDTSGPTMRLYLNDPSFVSGGVVGAQPTFIAELSDESGINLTQGIGNALTLILNNDERNPILLNDFYQARSESFTEGEVRYTFAPLRDGNYTLRFKAWDSYNNSSEKELAFVVRNASVLHVKYALNFPNPTRGQTSFFISHNQAGEQVEVRIKIYTIAGRLIKSLEHTETSAPSLVRIDWDGRDEDGSELANGIYLYKVIFKHLTRNEQIETLEKLAIVR
jgi:hypothetical protein